MRGKKPLNSKCKGPEVGKSLSSSRNRKEEGSPKDEAGDKAELPSQEGLSGGQIFSLKEMGALKGFKQEVM